MSRRTLSVALAALLATAALTGWWLLQRSHSATPPGHTATSSEDQSMAGMPGMAGMSPSGTISLTADQIRSFGVTFGTVELRQLESTIRATGVVVLDETRVTQVATKVSGFVDLLYVDFTGKVVRRGQPLYALYSPDLVAAQEELLAAVRLPPASGTFAVPGLPSGHADLLAAAERRLRLWDVSALQIAELRRRGSARRTLTFYAPAAGVVLEKHVVQGQAVEVGQPLYTIADLTRVWLEADLREGDAAALAVGARVEAEFGAYPGRPVIGRVAFIAPTLDKESRALRARIDMPNSDGRLRPGIYGTVRIQTPSRRTLTVPASAVVRTGERSLVFVDLLGGRLGARDVETGRTAGGFTEVLAGLEPGQRVVTSAQFLLESESNLTDIMRSMIGQTGSAEMEGMEGMDMGPESGPDAKGADTRGTANMPMPEGE
jgi:membrane fusion protein, copper/silver efflux system